MTPKQETFFMRFGLPLAILFSIAVWTIAGCIVIG